MTFNYNGITTAGFGEPLQAVPGFASEPGIGNGFGYSEKYTAGMRVSLGPYFGKLGISGANNHPFKSEWVGQRIILTNSGDYNGHQMVLAVNISAGLTPADNNMVLNTAFSHPVIESAYPDRRFAVRNTSEPQKEDEFEIEAKESNGFGYYETFPTDGFGINSKASVRFGLNSGRNARFGYEQYGIISTFGSGGDFPGHAMIYGLSNIEGEPDNEIDYPSSWLGKTITLINSGDYNGQHTILAVNHSDWPVRPNLVLNTEWLGIQINEDNHPDRKLYMQEHVPVNSYSIDSEPGDKFVDAGSFGYGPLNIVRQGSGHFSGYAIILHGGVLSLDTNWIGKDITVTGANEESNSGFNGSYTILDVNNSIEDGFAFDDSITYSAKPTTGNPSTMASNPDSFFKIPDVTDAIPSSGFVIN